MESRHHAAAAELRCGADVAGPIQRGGALRFLYSWRSWIFGVAIGLFVSVTPIVYFRIVYTEQKRFRIVTPGKFYRSGCMTGQGLEDTIKQYNIRTVLNVLDETPNPTLRRSFFSGVRERENDLCRRLGARMIHFGVNTVPINRSPATRPDTIEDFLKVMDDPNSYPVLLHCKAGLHRTGVLVGIYRMEYEGWSTPQALAEVRSNGFGALASSSANLYISQYILQYQPHLRPGRVVEHEPNGRPVTGNLTSRPMPLPDAYQPLPNAVPLKP